MLTLVISIVAAGLLAGLVWVTVASLWGAIVIGIVGFLGASIALNLWVKRRLEAIFAGVQQALTQQQQVLQRKMNRLQNSMGGGGKGLQHQLEKEQSAGIKDALAKLTAAKPLYKWNVLAERQVNTLQGQLAYQIQDFATADRCLAKALLMDPLTMAMKMARLYEHDDMAAVEKLFRKGRKRFKDDKATLIYGLYSWILVKRTRIDDAIEVLAEGKAKTESSVLKQNWEHLVNGRLRQFSNASLGDEWFALHLEKPKPVKMRQQSGRRRF